LHGHVHYWIHHYGYFGVFFILFTEMIGFPFPAETTLTFSGIAWIRGEFSLLPLLAAAAGGNIAGSSVAYAIGRFVGQAVIVRFGKRVGITEEKFRHAEKRFNKYQISVILFAKFVAGIRVLVPYLAGINRMPFLTFTVYNAISALVWSGVFIVLGRYLGVVWRHYAAAIHPYLLPGAVGVAFLVAVTMAARKRGFPWQRRMNREEPEIPETTTEKTDSE
jgi:membrane protein DedA with SNARE-associated domain